MESLQRLSFFRIFHSSYYEDNSERRIKMEIFQVIETVDVIDYFNHFKNETYDVDRGLYVSVEAAIQAIDEFADQSLKTAIQDANDAWISAYPAEEFVNDYTLIVLRKSIMFYARNDGHYIRLDYYIKKREVKELA